MPDIEFIRAEIQRTRLQVLRHRNEIMQLHRAGLTTTSAEALLDRMLNKIDDLCAERDAQLMVSEKIDAALKASASRMAGASGDEIVRRYRSRVAANAKRLGRLNLNRPVLRRTRRSRK